MKSNFSLEWTYVFLLHRVYVLYSSQRTCFRSSPHTLSSRKENESAGEHVAPRRHVGSSRRERRRVGIFRVAFRTYVQFETVARPAPCTRRIDKSHRTSGGGGSIARSKTKIVYASSRRLTPRGRRNFFLVFFFFFYRTNTHTSINPSIRQPTTYFPRRLVKVHQYQRTTTFSRGTFLSGGARARRYIIVAPPPPPPLSDGTACEHPRDSHRSVSVRRGSAGALAVRPIAFSTLIRRIFCFSPLVSFFFAPSPVPSSSLWTFFGRPPKRLNNSTRRARSRQSINATPAGNDTDLRSAENPQQRSYAATRRSPKGSTAEVGRDWCEQ